LVIKDAHIITDMVDANLFQAWLTSENKPCVPDFAHLEFRRCSEWRVIAPLISGGLIEVNTFEAHDIPALDAIKTDNGISITDACAVRLCQDKSGIIVTHDPKLKNACVSIPVPCAEILWIFDHLLHKGSLPFSSALDGLNLLIARKSIHDSVEVQKRIEAWSRQHALSPSCETPQLSGIRKKRKKSSAMTSIPAV
jgi:hypothetical protein